MNYHLRSSQQTCDPHRDRYHLFLGFEYTTIISEFPVIRLKYNPVCSGIPLSDLHTRLQAGAHLLHKEVSVPCSWILSQFQPTKQLFWCSLSIQPYTVFLPQALILRHFLIGSILSPDFPTLPDHTVYFLHFDKQTSPSHFFYKRPFLYKFLLLF